METEIRILYVADPMCSWCWGFAPVLESLRKAYPKVKVQIVLGGLAPDSSEPMEDSMQAYVQQAWHDVAARSGVTFNYDYWTTCAPRRSTWPSCRAVVIARRHGLEREMFAAIQKAYYLDARNPSDDDTLADLAQALGLDRDTFLAALHSEDIQAALNEDFDIRRSIGANSFPSLGVERDGQRQLVHSGWGDEELILRVFAPILQLT
jgi:putative protein-disulfide isomerase